MFGRDVNFFYKGQEYYSTNWGIFVSLCISTAILTMVSLKLVEFFGVTDPIEYFSQTPQSMDEIIDLGANGFSFGIEAIEKELGEVKVEQIKWSGITGDKTITDITMEPCDSLQPSNLSFVNEFSEKRRGKPTPYGSYLCPSPDSYMET